MKISVHDAGGELANLTDMRTKGFPPRLLCQPLRDSNNRHQDGCGYYGRKDKRIVSEASRRVRHGPVWFGHCRTKPMIRLLWLCPLVGARFADLKFDHFETCKQSE
jgi:hypothetical protein